MEHEERVRADDDFRNHVEMKDRLQEERMRYEREEMRDRYAAMDSNIRAEFQRKDEALRSLHSLLETSYKQLLNGIKAEEASRLNSEAALRGDFVKFQEILRREVDLFKGEQTTVNGKLMEMMKVEVDTRLSSDVELKNHTSVLAANLATDLAALRDAAERQNKQFATDLRAISGESAERANQVSRYVDSEVKRLDETSTQRYEKTKVLLAKIAEQFKNHLLNFEAVRKETTDKMAEAEAKAARLDAEKTKAIGEVEVRLLAKLRDESESLLTFCESRVRPVEEGLTNLEERLRKNIEVVMELHDNGQKLLTHKMDKLAETNQAMHQAHREELQRLLEDFDALVASVAQLQQSQAEAGARFSVLFAQLETQLNTEIIGERNLRVMGEHSLRTTIAENSATTTRMLANFKVLVESVDRELRNENKTVIDRVRLQADQISEAFAKLYSFYDGLKAVEARLDGELETLVARSNVFDLFARSEFSTLKTELSELLEIVMDESIRERKFKSEALTMMLQFNEAAAALNKKVEDEIKGYLEARLIALFEQLKRESDTMWQTALRHSSSNVLPAILATNDRQVRLAQVIGVEDDYAKPMVN
eukprot:TRINITY_DN12260_c0_g1_i2.p1 TRINITY_DN12260_c0_g1~~TRINITY_DN12260_c0_g1_i2.p1  ORF type:complete len:594 (+),score=192.62 TRINITY_DN12260_c0_g1_i2:215-1996(+)